MKKVVFNRRFYFGWIDRKSIDTAVRWCLEDQFEMDTYSVYLVGKSPKWLGKRLAAFWPPNCIYLNVRRIKNDPRVNFYRTLFHELRHYYQHTTGMFDFDSEWFTRENSKFARLQVGCSSEKVITRVHDDLPWEKDANRVSAITYRRWKQMVKKNK